MVLNLLRGRARTCAVRMWTWLVTNQCDPGRCTIDAPRSPSDPFFIATLKYPRSLGPLEPSQMLGTQQASFMIRCSHPGWSEHHVWGGCAGVSCCRSDQRFCPAHLIPSALHHLQRPAEEARQSPDRESWCTQQGQSKCSGKLSPQQMPRCVWVARRSVEGKEHSHCLCGTKADLANMKNRQGCGSEGLIQAPVCCGYR